MLQRNRPGCEARFEASVMKRELKHQGSYSDLTELSWNWSTHVTQFLHTLGQDKSKPVILQWIKGKGVV
jgi:hypothetical protein